jgi:hypothetical protein
MSQSGLDAAVWSRTAFSSGVRTLAGLGFSGSILASSARRTHRHQCKNLWPFVLSSKHIFWNSGMIKARFTGTAYDNTFIARIFMGDHAEVGTTAKLEGGLLSMRVQYLNRDEVITFIKISPQALGEDRWNQKGRFHFHPERVLYARMASL